MLPSSMLAEASKLHAVPAQSNEKSGSGASLLTSMFGKIATCGVKIAGPEPVTPVGLRT